MALTSNYPNPFSARTVFDLDLAVDANVVADVFNVAGQRVRHIELGRLSAGSRAMSFDGLGADGRRLPSGVYFYRVTANGASVTRKMVIAR
jgi:flagellar hook assembly protein FlgD